uniref:Ras-GEF domain-containing protein n=1 Tax=Brugia timori TaxID=42155 RepID=A0A0R3QDE2_9BILA
LERRIFLEATNTVNYCYHLQLYVNISLLERLPKIWKERKRERELCLSFSK